MTSAELDEIIIHRWPLVMRSVEAGTDEWLKGFVRSIARHAKRASWEPTDRQEQIMRRLVSEQGTAPNVTSLIEND